ncbi:PAF acetylhydrolase [Trichoderma reesei RUT C-30]|jgi:platelet-activating factor acetylhydrolase|uniref:Putative phospholipase n=1 Tax=Hypocrea jecorina (strain ATCC 56765 / BCRC 32924 / NRRL 11460 / Rut C-30) TaxID=1344414 RepID=A0A024S545_HYPJR|nr:PAF acetylhydrolase [Trichoderma reesei RUT C-30]
MPPTNSKSKAAPIISSRPVRSPDDNDDDTSALELDSVHDQDFSLSPEPELEPEPPESASLLPDSPLLTPADTQPRWLLFSQQQQSPPWSSRNPRFTRWWRRSVTFVADLLRPRLTWRYVASAALMAYVVLCLVRGVPLLAHPLPAYTGRFDVGAVDIEVPLDKPRLVTETVFKDSGEPAFEHKTTLFTVYYPVDKGVREHRPRHDWIARPISLTAEGYAKFAGVNNFIVRPIFTFALWLIAGGITIPAKVDVPLLNSTDDDDDVVPEPFPVMVFSHGDASSRTDYTNFVGEMASRGYVVAAVEHRDGSGPGSLMRIHGEPDKKILHFKEAELESVPPMDRAKYKYDQLAFRDAEILHAVAVLRAINDGKGEDVYRRNSRLEGAHLHAWAGRLDLGNLTIGGHSFGATGALQALKHAPSDANPAVGGIIFDPGKESGPLNAVIDVPLLIVHSNTWSKHKSAFYGRPHFDTVKELALGVLRRIPSHASWFLTSIGTSHPSVSDAPLLEPLLLSWTTGSSLDTKEAMKEYVRVADDFWHFLRTSRDTNTSRSVEAGGPAVLDGQIVQKGEMRGVLAEKVTHEQYGEWVSKERKDEFPKAMAKLWEVHVSPVSDEEESDGGGDGNEKDSIAYRDYL